MIIEKNSFFCIGDLLNGTEIYMKCIYSDGQSMIYSGVKMNAPNAKYYENTGELWIAVKDRTGRQISEIQIRIRPHGGSVERLCLKYGSARFDTVSRSYKTEWENGVLRHDLIKMTVGEKTADIVFLLSAPAVKQVPKEAPKEIPKAAAGLSVSNDDLSLKIKEDLKIIGFYSGDSAGSAADDLNRAAVLMNNDPSAADLLVCEAEKLIKECVERSMNVVHAYRN